MIGYYFNLALRSFRRNKVLTALMVLAIALGIGAAMTTLTVFHVLSADPMPGKSDKLHYVQLDAPDLDDYQPGAEPDVQLTRFDGEALLRAKRGSRQAMMSAGQANIMPERNDLEPFSADTRQTSSDFFSMFEPPLRYGRGWTAQDDADAARVVVLSGDVNDKLFAGADSVGRTVRIDSTDFRVVGVLKRWRPGARFYDLVGDPFVKTEDLFLPFSTARALDMGRQGSMSCWGTGGGNDPLALNAPCTWTQFWVQLDTPEQARAYKEFLVRYSHEQHASGRFQRPPNVRLRDLNQLLEFRGVVPNDVKMQVWLAFGFFAVCLLNTAGLLLAKFLRRSGEIGVRRALGASKPAIFTQYLIEAGAIGLVGGVLGLGLAWLGLWAVRQQPVEYADLARFDPLMLLLTFVIAVAASMLAGLLPAWQACRVTPALQLKTQ